MADEYQSIETAPRVDGESVVLKLVFELPAFWSDELGKWVLHREGKLDSIYPDRPKGWKPYPEPWKRIPHESKVS